VLNLLWKARIRIDQRGQGMVEYALILVLVAVVVIVALGPLGQAIQGKFQSITSSITSAGGGGG
jgi:pilus assembly protein Flp/PilA